MLREEWDPIGVPGVPENEYDSYVGGVYRLLTKGADARRLAALVAQLERVSMGLRERDGADPLPVVHKLLELHIARRHRDPAA